MAERWTPETEELVSDKLHAADCEWSWDECRTDRVHARAAGDILEALAEAGLLLPPGVEPRVETGISFRHGVSPCRASCLKEPQHVHDRERTVYVGPWVEVTPDA